MKVELPPTLRLNHFQTQIQMVALMRYDFLPSFSFDSVRHRHLHHLIALLVLCFHTSTSFHSTVQSPAQSVHHESTCQSTLNQAPCSPLAFSPAKRLSTPVKRPWCHADQIRIAYTNHLKLHHSCLAPKVH